MCSTNRAAIVASSALNHSKQPHSSAPSAQTSPVEDRSNHGQVFTKREKASVLVAREAMDSMRRIKSDGSVVVVKERERERRPRPLVGHAAGRYS